MHHPLEHCIEVDKYEEVREPRRPQSALKMDSRTRHNILMDEWEFSMYAVMIAQQETCKVREQRMKTSKRARRAMIREESLVALKKSLKKYFTINRTSSAKQENDSLLLGNNQPVMLSLSPDEYDDSYSSSDEEL